MKHCCSQMENQVNYQCEIHESKFDCPDVLISYIDKFDEYGLIIHDGGTASIEIKYCPFCGEKLPESKRELWFEKLESLGFTDPGEQEIPEEYLSDKWFH